MYKLLCKKIWIQDNVYCRSQMKLNVKTLSISTQRDSEYIIKKRLLTFQEKLVSSVVPAEASCQLDFTWLLAKDDDKWSLAKLLGMCGTACWSVPDVVCRISTESLPSASSNREMTHKLHVKWSEVSFIYIAQHHNSQICLQGLYSLSILCPQTLYLDQEKSLQKTPFNIYEAYGSRRTSSNFRCYQTDLSHMTSFPPWRPGKRTNYSNTQEAKLKHTIHSDRRKQTNTQREWGTRTTCTQRRERQEERLNLPED